VIDHDFTVNLAGSAWIVVGWAFLAFIGFALCDCNNWKVAGKRCVLTAAGLAGVGFAIFSLAGIIELWFVP